MNRLRARAGRALGALALLFAIAFASVPAPASAQSTPTFWLGGTRLIFEHADRVDDEIAVRTTDPGLVAFLSRVGATISAQSGSRYVVVTTAERRTLTFTLGTPTFQTSSATELAPLKAYVDGSDIYIPFLTLARALYVLPIKEGNEYVLQPQLGALDVKIDGRKTIVTLHGGTKLHLKRTVDSPERLTFAIPGTASSLVASRRVDGPGLTQIAIVGSGSARSPTTTIEFDVPPNSVRAYLPAASANESVFAFGPRDVALGGSPVPLEIEGASIVAAVAPAVVRGIPSGTPAPRAIATATPSPLPHSTVTPSPAPLPRAVATPSPYVPSSSPSPLALDTPQSASALPSGTPAPAFVTAVDVTTPAPDTMFVRVAVSAGAPYEWHRLADNRFYVDVRGATLSFAPREIQTNVGFAQSVRINQLAGVYPATVRVALTLMANRRIEVVSDPNGVTLSITDADAGVALRAGTGTIGTPDPNVAVAVAPLPTPVPSDWKFGSTVPPPPGSNPRLIVIDPGHGGSDAGASHNGLVEKDITLDVAMRLRALLVARGWTVRMTRDRDVDVYGPNASDVAELQARVDVGNNAAARLFVSVHVNSSTSTAPNGTTAYYYKPEDRALAAAIQRRLIPSLGTKDDGVQKERFYVIRHTTMPATLIETAFVSNPDDAARLRTAEFRQALAQGIADGIRDFAGAPAGSISQRGE